MWVPRETYERLLTEAAQVKPLQNALAAAEERAVTAEDALASERNGKDHLILQLTSRVLTKHGQYGLDHEPTVVEPITHPKGYTHDPTEFDLAKLEFYKNCAREAGHDEEDAVARWEAEMRGQEIKVDFDTEQ